MQIYTGYTAVDGNIRNVYTLFNSMNNNPSLQFSSEWYIYIYGLATIS